MCRKNKIKHTVLIKKDETEILMNKTILTSLNYGQWIKSITKNVLEEWQHNESITEMNYPM